MINESYPWKIELLKIASSFKKCLSQKRWTKESSFLFEKEIFVSLYIVRKLIEAEKISDGNKNLKISCYITPSNGKNVHRFNIASVDRLYDFTKTNFLENNL